MLEIDCANSLNNVNLKYEGEVYNKSREYSELYVAGSLNKKEDLSSINNGLLGVAHRFLGRLTIEFRFAKNCLYKNSRRLKISISFDVL